jgi:predicted NodU family carbamoyl transferase
MGDDVGSVDPFSPFALFGRDLSHQLQSNFGEFKVMGLAPYGEPKYAQLILDHLIDLKPDGSFRLDMS